MQAGKAMIDTVLFHPGQTLQAVLEGFLVEGGEWKLSGVYGRVSPGIPLSEGLTPGGLEQFWEWLEASRPMALCCVVCERLDEFFWMRLNLWAEQHHCRLLATGNPGLPASGWKPAGCFGQWPLFQKEALPLFSRAGQWYKQVFDFFFSLLVIGLVVPWLFPVTALAIVLESKGPVFFRQQRPGKGGKLFTCYKFRTLYLHSPTDIPVTKNDLRVTRVGALLRKVSIDEMPQFFNVLRGEMSVVGPRPIMVGQRQWYTRHIGGYVLREMAKPGITGLAQVNGYRGEPVNLANMEQRVALDLCYLASWHPFADLKIIAKTVVNILKGDRNAY